MCLIRDSDLDAETKQLLLRVRDDVISTVLAHNRIMYVAFDEFSDAVSQAVLILARAGQKDPIQLTRYATYRASIILRRLSAHAG